MLLTFNVEKQIIMRTDTEKVVTNSMNYLYARFTFSEEWTGEKTAVFSAQKKTYNALLDENNTCLVPWEALTGSIFTVSVFCGDLITANKVIIYTIPSGYEVGDESRIPTPEIYTQVIEKLNEIEQEIDPEAIQQIVDTYLADKDFVTENDVETIVSQYVAEHVHGIPTGGTTGQVLVKSSSTDYATEWVDGGSGSGDMTKSTYDPNGVVEDAGGIEGYVGEEISDVKGIINVGIFQPISSTVIKKYIQNNSGLLYDDNNSALMEFDVQEGEQYRITGAYQYKTAIMGLYNGNTCLGTYPSDNISHSTLTTETITVTIPSGVTLLRACTYRSSLTVEKLEPNGKSVDYTFNILYGKKWAACGDSFTCGDFTGYTDKDGHTGTDSDAYDPITEKWKNYSWWISQRNKMNIQLLALGGNDFTNIEGATRPFSNPNTTTYNYTKIANDCDYVTLAFGLNENGLTSEQIGTKTDTTNATLWGAYNVVLEAILTANPSVKIGIIISDAWLSQTYHDALIEIAKYWGVPYLDLRDGEEIPMMIGGELREHSSKAATLRNSVFAISGTSGGHPTPKGFEYRSTVIENFLRSL